MTIKGQNIETYQGNNINIIIDVDISETPDMDIETCTFTFAIYKQTTEQIALLKSSSDGITADNVTNEVAISLSRANTRSLLGHYSHILKMLDTDDNEFTVSVGTIDILRSVI